MSLSHLGLFFLAFLYEMKAMRRSKHNKSLSLTRLHEYLAIVRQDELGNYAIVMNYCTY